jgi:hypothetical protein
LRFRQWHRDITGGEPPNGKQPSSLQLGALHYRISRGGHPYVDFAVFTPFGNRQMKHHKFDSQVWIENRIQQAKIQGPSDYTSWKASWDVFRAAMVSIKAGSPAMLDAYSFGIERLAIRYPGDANWGFISCADETLRNEVWLDKKDRLVELNKWPEHMPWDHVLSVTSFGSDEIGPGMDRWWDDHVIHPCTNARNGRRYLAELEGTDLQPFPQGMGAGRAASNQPAGSNSRSKRQKQNNPAQAQGDPNRVRLWDARPKHEQHKGGGKGGGKGGHGGNKGGHGGNKGGKGGNKGGKGGKPDPRK